jgi:hypothetical protein
MSLRSLEWTSLLVQFIDPKKIIPYLTCDTERKFNDFTLYFLAFNHEGKDLTKEEKEASRFSREGSFFFVSFAQHSNGNFSPPLSVS